MVSDSLKSTSITTFVVLLLFILCSLAVAGLIWWHSRKNMNKEMEKEQDTLPNDIKLEMEETAKPSQLL